MEHLVLTGWAASHVWALISSSQPLLLVAFGALLLTSSAVARVGGGDGEAAAKTEERNHGKQIARVSSFPRTSGPRTSDAVPESLRHLTQNAAAREQAPAPAEGMFHHV